MNLLLDTHTFLWWIDGAPELSVRAREAIGEPHNRVFFSAVSGWEIAVKSGLGRLTLPAPPAQFVPAQVIENSFDVLPIGLTHALAVDDLPRHHKDPFDRLLVAQAQTEGMAIATRDPALAAYEVELLW